MRYFLVILLCSTLSLFAGERQKVTLGFGPYIQSEPYKGTKDLILPSPVIFFDNGIVYARWSRFGIYFLGEKKEDYAWGFSVTAQPRTLGYKASDSNYLKGMNERKSTFEGGLAFSASYQNSKYIEIMLLGDMLNRYNGWISRAEIGDKYNLGDFTFYPSMVLLYQSRKFTDYYYGVKNSEATADRPVYSPHGGLEYGAQTYIKYPFTKELSALVNLRYDIISKNAKNSPLTDDNYIYSGLFSLIYTFEY
ncbi:MipA/OmpV family protein [Sulfurimonas paralvinellae]|uniref:MipA/OmpV family protein n=1 Tax=Sulfurimonas paralvinellae TaxID=317658 RepID=A0A7M1B8J3_9BACT|nr:MipA/OmpV family protein [Sulfurimonas paralvinellae]QOP46063.1 MipA/OmpV family protein [Sulfurimonas paralvinellae]